MQESEGGCWLHRPSSRALLGCRHGLTMEVVAQLPGVGQGLDDAVHEAGVAQVHQPREARQAHLLLLVLILIILHTLGAHGAVCHRWHHARRFRLPKQR